VLAVLASLWFYMYIIKTTPFVLGGREFSDREKFLLLAGSSLFVIFFLTRFVVRRMPIRHISMGFLCVCDLSQYFSLHIYHLFSFAVLVPQFSTPLA